MNDLPRAGDTVKVAGPASVQFAARPLLFRVIRVLDWETYQGWVWLEGYELSEALVAVERRNIFVQPAGLELVDVDAYRRQRIKNRKGSKG